MKRWRIPLFSLLNLTITNEPNLKGSETKKDENYEFKGDHSFVNRDKAKISRENPPEKSEKSENRNFIELLFVRIEKKDDRILRLLERITGYQIEISNLKRDYSDLEKDFNRHKKRTDKQRRKKE